MPLVPLRANNAYFGMAKQTVQGTAVAPTTFPRWLDGTAIDLALSVEEIMEGDSTRHISLIVKNKQEVKLKLATYVRPIVAGLIEAATMGTGSDAITTTTPTSTSTGAVTAGSSTSITLTSGTGFAATGQSGTFQMLVGVGTSADPYETVTFTAPTSGAVLTVAAGYNTGKFAQSHPSGTTVANVAAINTSFTSSAIVGATTIVVGNQIGISGTPLVVLSPGTINEEVVTLTASSVTGTGPWTYTLAGSATLKNAHTSGDTVIAAVSHVETDQTEGDYYTCEVNLGGASGITLRVRDCKVDQCKISADSGKVVKYEVDLTGIACTVQGTPSTVTLENHLPFLFTQANGAWTIDGSTTGDAVAIQKLEITRKNNLDAVQTEALILAAIIFGKLQAEASLTIVYSNNTKINQAFFGSATGTTDAQPVVIGSVLVTFTQADGMNALTLSLPSLVYSKVTLPVPKADGKAFTLPIMGNSTSNNGATAYMMKTTVANFQTTTY
jgi:hypothetical protein